MLALRYLNIDAYWVKYSRARTQTPKEVAIVFTSFLTRLVRRRTTYSSSASFLPQIDAKVGSVLLRPLRRIVCSPKPTQLKRTVLVEIFSSLWPFFVALTFTQFTDLRKRLNQASIASFLKPDDLQRPSW